MRITEAGGGIVGIGTTSPGNSKLHIYADHISGHSILKIQTITAIASGGVPSLALFDADGSRNTLVYAASDGTYLANEVAKPIIFSTNGVEKMRIASDGNVGIGTSSLTAKLQIASTNNQAAIYTTGATTGFTYLQIQNSGGSNYFGMSDSNGAFWSTTPYTSYHATIGTAANIPLTFTTNNLIRMLLDNSGNLGIGTVSPATKLEVYGVVRITESASGGILQMQAGSSALDFASTFYGGTYRPFTFTNGGAERLRITSDGNVGIGTTTPAYKLDVAGSVYSSNYFSVLTAATYGPSDNSAAMQVFGSTGSGGLTNTIKFVTGGSERVRIDSSGNVGIGTSSPTYVLDVNSANDSAIRIRNGAGSANNGLALAVGSGTPWLDITEGAEFRIKGNTYANLGTWNSGNNTKILINSSGNVGIGTTSPAAKLDVAGNSKLGSSISNVHQITGSLSITGSVSGINTESFHPFLLG